MCITAIIEGFIWSVLWIIYVYVIVTKYPWMMLHDYPKDIQEASTLPEPTSDQRKSAKRFGLIGSLVIFGTIIAFGLIYFAGVSVSYLRVLAFILIIAMVWNTVDLVIMDWLIICTITAKWVIIEGTEDCKGYKDYFYHFKAFLIGCVYSTIMSLVIAGIDYAVLYFLIWR